MTLFANWIIGIVTQLATLIGLSLTKKAAVYIAAITTGIGFTLALGAFISSLLTTIAFALPSWAAPGAYMLPINLPYCLSAIVAAKVARFIYDWNMENIKIASYIT